MYLQPYQPPVDGCAFVSSFMDPLPLVVYIRLLLVHIAYEALKPHDPQRPLCLVHMLLGYGSAAMHCYSKVCGQHSMALGRHYTVEQDATVCVAAQDQLLQV